MSFWDDFADKAKKGVQKVQEFTMETVDKVKIKSRISKLNSEVKKLYTRIGELIYEERCGDAIVENSAEISELISSISEAKKEISELKEQLDNE